MDSRLAPVGGENRQSFAHPGAARVDRLGRLDVQSSFYDRIDRGRPSFRTGIRSVADRAWAASSNPRVAECLVAKFRRRDGVAREAQMAAATGSFAGYQPGCTTLAVGLSGCRTAMGCITR